MGHSTIVPQRMIETMTRKMQPYSRNKYAGQGQSQDRIPSLSTIHII